MQVVITGFPLNADSNPTLPVHTKTKSELLIHLSAGTSVGMKVISLEIFLIFL